MTEQEFLRYLSTAKYYSRYSQQPNEPDFWTGYIRGLLRHFYHEKYDNPDDHALWMTFVDAPDISRKMQGFGYILGYEGLDITESEKIYSQEADAHIFQA